MLLASIGTRLRLRRLEMGLTQSALAKKACVSPRFLVQLEGGTGNMSRLSRLAPGRGTRDGWRGSLSGCVGAFCNNARIRV